MALKKLTVSFDLSIPVFLSMLAAGNGGMKIDVFGDDKPARVPKALRNGNAVAGLLEHHPKQPKQAKQAKQRKLRTDNTSHVRWRSGKDIARALFLEYKDNPLRPSDFATAFVAAGLAAKSVSPQLSVMLKAREIKRLGNGKYRITPHGIRVAQKIAAAKAQEDQPQPATTPGE